MFGECFSFNNRVDSFQMRRIGTQCYEEEKNQNLNWLYFEKKNENNNNNNDYKDEHCHRHALDDLMMYPNDIYIDEKTF